MLLSSIRTSETTKLDNRDGSRSTTHPRITLQRRNNRSNQRTKMRLIITTNTRNSTNTTITKLRISRTERIKDAETLIIQTITVTINYNIIGADTNLNQTQNEQDKKKPTEHLEILVNKTTSPLMLTHKITRQLSLQTLIQTTMTLAKSHATKDAIKSLSSKRTILRREDRKHGKNDKSNDTYHEEPRGCLIVLKELWKKRKKKEVNKEN